LEPQTIALPPTQKCTLPLKNICAHFSIGNQLTALKFMRTSAQVSIFFCSLLAAFGRFTFHARNISYFQNVTFLQKKE
jgi:hypothetical protein